MADISTPFVDAASISKRHKSCVIKPLADFAFVAGLAVAAVFAVNRLCQNFGAGGFARAP
jgi:hypothetical protein